jgi:hypothetical protein
MLPALQPWITRMLTVSQKYGAQPLRSLIVAVQNLIWLLVSLTGR